MTPCPEVGALQAALGDPAVDASILQHLEQCPACQRLLEHSLGSGATVAAVRRGARATPLPPGYTVLAELHRGGQGVVYEALQDSTGKRVALKLLLGGQLSTRMQRARFERELRTLAKLRHPNVVAILDGRASGDGPAYIAMEYAGGLRLDGYVEALRRQGTPLDLAQRLELFHAVADAVAHAHAEGVVHRDLKPANVVVDERGAPRVVDFGLAVSQGAQSRVTNSGDFVGSLSWCAPEQLETGGRADERTDVYALGLLLYLLLTDRQPRPEESGLADLVERMGGNHLRRPSTVAAVPGVDRRLDAVVRRALAADPDERYRDAGELRDELERWRRGERLTVRTGTLAELQRFARRHRVATASAALLLLGAGAAGLARDLRAGERRADLITSATDSLQRGEYALAEAILRREVLAPTRSVLLPGGERVAGDTEFAWALQGLVANQRCTAARQVPTTATDLRWSPTGDTLVVLEEGAGLVLYDAELGERLRTAWPGLLRSPRFDAEGRYFAAEDEVTGEIPVWAARGALGPLDDGAWQEPLVVLQGHGAGFLFERDRILYASSETELALSGPIGGDSARDTREERYRLDLEPTVVLGRLWATAEPGQYIVLTVDRNSISVVKYYEFEPAAGPALRDLGPLHGAADLGRLEGTAVSIFAGHVFEQGRATLLRTGSLLPSEARMARGPNPLRLCQFFEERLLVVEYADRDSPLELVEELVGHRSSVRAVDATAGLVASLDASGELRVWRVQEFSWKHCLRDGPDDLTILDVALDRDPSRFWTADGKLGTVTLRSGADEVRVLELPDTGLTYGVAPSSRHELLAYSTGIGEYGWFLADGTRELLPRARPRECISNVLRFGPDESQLAGVDDLGVLRLWSAPDGDLELERQISEQRIGALAWSADGELLALGGAAGFAWFDVTTGELMRGPYYGLGTVTDVALRAADATCYTVEWRGPIRAWRRGSSLPCAVRERPKGTNLLSVAVDEAGELVAVGANDGSVLFLRAGDLELLARIPVADRGIFRLVFLPGGRQLLTVGEEGQVWQLDLDELERAGRMRLDGWTGRGSP